MTDTFTIALPNNLAPPAKSGQLFQKTDEQGNDIVVKYGVRQKHSRSATIIHPWPTVMMLLTGRITVYEEGKAPLTARAPFCRKQEPNIRYFFVNDDCDDAFIVFSWFISPASTDSAVLEI